MNKKYMIYFGLGANQTRSTVAALCLGKLNNIISIVLNVYLNRYLSWNPNSDLAEIWMEIRIDSDTIVPIFGFLTW